MSITVNDVSVFSAILYEPDDIIEVRMIDPRKALPPTSIYTTGQALPYLFSTRLDSKNQAGYGIYVGVCPRTHEGGTRTDDVEMVRCLWADFDDGATIVEVHDAISQAGLPKPTLTISSGGGIHIYYKLEKPLSPAEGKLAMKEFTDALTLFGSDKSVKDISRIMRLPGSKNTKPNRKDAVVSVVEHNISTVKWEDIATIISKVSAPKPVVIPAPAPTVVAPDERAFMAYMKKFPPAISGQGGDTETFKLGCIAHDFAIPQDRAFELINQHWNPNCQPPWDAVELKEIIRNAYSYAQNPVGSKVKEDKRPISDQLLALMSTKNIKFFTDTKTTMAMAAIKENGRTEVYDIHKREFKRYISKMYGFNKAIPGNKMRDAIETFTNMAEESYEVFRRVGYLGDTVYIDLCNADRQVVAVTPTGWSITQEPPVYFIRDSKMIPLPVPTAGNMDDFNDLFPFDEDTNILLLSWCLQTMNPHGSYPVLALLASQGTGKSSTETFLQKLLDPNVAYRCKIPTQGRDLSVALSNRHVSVFDNADYLDGDMQSTLCIISTGGTTEQRALYSDGDTFSMDIKKPVILTSVIDMLITRPDLLDRTIRVCLPKIPDSKLLSEKELHDKFTRLQPKILAFLLDCVSEAMKNLTTTVLPSHTRMMDFARFATAAEPKYTTPGKFMEVYERTKNEATIDNTNDWPLMDTLKSLLQFKDFDGKVGQLYDELTRRAGDKAKQKSWPGNPRTLSSQLNRYETGMKAIGIIFEKKRAADGVIIHLRLENKQPMPNVFASNTPDSTIEF